MIEQIQIISEEKQDAELQRQLWVDVTLSCGGAGRSEADEDIKYQTHALDTYVIRSHRECLAIPRHMARQMTRSRISKSR